MAVIGDVGEPTPMSQGIAKKQALMSGDVMLRSMMRHTVQHVSQIDVHASCTRSGTRGKGLTLTLA